MDKLLAIASKRDQREYADREIPADVVERILQAGRIAGSAQNRQPWRFVVLETPEARREVAQTVYAPGNVEGSTRSSSRATPGWTPAAACRT